MQVSYNAKTDLLYLHVSFDNVSDVA